MDQTRRMALRHFAFIFTLDFKDGAEKLGFFMSCIEVTSTDPCSTYKNIQAASRLVENEMNNDTNCDKDLEEAWYRFISNKQPAIIPTKCIKNNYCGTQLGMFIDLMGQQLPNVSQTITVKACSSFDILGTWDCCVLSKKIEMRRCSGDFYIYHLKPSDRCPVAYCTVLQNDPVEIAYTAQHGIVVNQNLPYVSPKEMMKEQTTLETSFISSAASTVAPVAITDIPAQNLVTVNGYATTDVQAVKTKNGTSDHIKNATVSEDKNLKTKLHVTATTVVRKTTVPTTVKTTTENEEKDLLLFGSGEEKQKEWNKKYFKETSTVVTPLITAFEKTTPPNQTVTAEPSQDIFQEYLALFIILMIIGFLCLILLLSSCMYLYCQRHSGHWDRALAEQYHVTVVPRRDALINESPYSDEVIIQDEKETNTLGSSFVNPENNLNYSNSIRAINDLNNLTMRNHPNEFNTQPLDGTEGLVIPIDQFRPEKDTMNIEDTIL